MRLLLRRVGERLGELRPATALGLLDDRALGEAHILGAELGHLGEHRLDLLRLLQRRGGPPRCVTGSHAWSTPSSRGGAHGSLR